MTEETKHRNYQDILKSYGYNGRFIILWNSGDYTIEDKPSRGDDTAIKLKDVRRLLIDAEKHCLDKQRVKEILKLKTQIWNIRYGGINPTPKDITPHRGKRNICF